MCPRARCDVFSHVAENQRFDDGFHRLVADATELVYPPASFSLHPPSATASALVCASSHKMFHRIKSVIRRHCCAIAAPGLSVAFTTRCLPFYPFIHTFFAAGAHIQANTHKIPPPPLWQQRQAFALSRAHLPKTNAPPHQMGWFVYTVAYQPNSIITSYSCYHHHHHHYHRPEPAIPNT